MTTERRTVSDETFSSVNFREAWGLKPKRLNRCPLCGVETTRGQRCKYHANARVNRRYRVIRMICEAVDEARADT